MGHAGRHGLQPGGADRPVGLFGLQRRGDIDVRNRGPDQGIAHASTDEARAVRTTRRLQRRHDRARGRGRQPWLVVEPPHAASSATATCGNASSPYSRVRSARTIPAVTPQI